jgi:hypothetical protein
VFSLAVKVFGFGDRYPFPRAGLGLGFEILGIVVAFFAVFDVKFDTGGGGVFDGCLEFRIGMRLDPEKAADAQRGDQRHTGEKGSERPKGTRGGHGRVFLPVWGFSRGRLRIQGEI